MKVFYKFDREFCFIRAEAFCNRLHTLFEQRSKYRFQMIKKMSEAKKALVTRVEKSLQGIEFLFQKRNEVYTGFYYLKHSRTTEVHSKHIKLGCFYLNKLSQAMFSRQKRMALIEMKHDMALGMSIMFSRMITKNGMADSNREDAPSSQKSIEGVDFGEAEGENILTVDNGSDEYLLSKTNTVLNSEAPTNNKSIAETSRKAGGQQKVVKASGGGSPSKFANGDKKGQMVEDNKSEKKKNVANNDKKKPSESQPPKREKALGGKEKEVSKPLPVAAEKKGKPTDPSLKNSVKVGDEKNKNVGKAADKVAPKKK